MRTEKSTRTPTHVRARVHAHTHTHMPRVRASERRSKRDRARARSPISTLLKKRYRHHSRQGFLAPYRRKGNVIIGVSFMRLYPQCGRIPTRRLIQNPADPRARLRSWPAAVLPMSRTTSFIKHVPRPRSNRIIFTGHLSSRGKNGRSSKIRPGLVC